MSRLSLRARVATVLRRSRRRFVNVDRLARSVASADVLWDELIDALSSDSHKAVEVAAGVIRASDGEGTFWVHVTPDQWRSEVVTCEVGAREAGRGFGVAYFYLDEMVGSRNQEPHIVYFQQEFERSIRAELPPVRHVGEPPPVRAGARGRIVMSNAEWSPHGEDD